MTRSASSQSAAADGIGLPQPGGQGEQFQDQTLHGEQG